MPYNYKKLLKKDNFCGHVNYSAPELIQERQTFSAKVDIWSLGCCLYYLCTKKDPFEGRNPQEIKQNIMVERLERYPSKFDLILKNLIHKCLEKDESKRLNAREMLEFQNSLELETYGEIRSSIMLKKMMEDYLSISSNPMIHKLSNCDSNSNGE
jgi:serine/threonine protein kinase